MGLRVAAGIRCAGQAVGRGTRRRCCRFSGQDGSATLNLHGSTVSVSAILPNSHVVAASRFLGSRSVFLVCTWGVVQKWLSDRLQNLSPTALYGPV